MCFIEQRALLLQFRLFACGQCQIVGLAVSLCFFIQDIDMFSDVALQVFACVIGLIGRNHLPLFTEHHSCEVTIP